MIAWLRAKGPRTGPATVAGGGGERVLERSCVRCSHHHCRDGTDVCRRMAAAADPVTGEVQYWTCWYERSSAWQTALSRLFGGRCGPSGRHWVERNSTVEERIRSL